MEVNLLVFFFFRMAPFPFQETAAPLLTSAEVGLTLFQKYNKKYYFDFPPYRSRARAVAGVQLLPREFQALCKILLPGRQNYKCFLGLKLFEHLPMNISEKFF